MKFGRTENVDAKDRWNFCRDTEFYDVVDSTNTIAARRVAEGCSPWHTVVAKGQTGGQGRLGRTFYSPYETGLYMSTVIYPDAQKLPLITGMAAVCVCEVLEKEFGAQPLIKWVNDIFIGERKICGILAKAQSTEKGMAVILGIGINIYAPEGDFPDDIKNTAGYLFGESKGEDIRMSLCEKIIIRLRERYATVGRDDTAKQYRKRCLTVGRKVTVYPTGMAERAREAYALGVDDDFHLTVEYPDKTTENLSSGEVSVRPKE